MSRCPVVRARGRVDDVAPDGTPVLRAWVRGIEVLFVDLKPGEWSMRGRRRERRSVERGLPVDVAIRANTLRVKIGRRREGAEEFRGYRLAADALREAIEARAAGRWSP